MLDCNAIVMLDCNGIPMAGLKRGCGSEAPTKKGSGGQSPSDWKKFAWVIYSALWTGCG